MPEYRYYSINPKTGAPVMDLPLYGTFMDKTFSGPGNFQGTYRLTSAIENGGLLIGGTIPGTHGMVCTRNDIPIWAGIIWSRTYAAESQTVQITGQTFESIFSHITCRVDFQNLVGAEENTLWTNLLNNLQTQVSGKWNFNIAFSSPGNTGNLRAIDYLGSEYRYFSEMTEQLSSYETGYGYTINISPGVSNADTITKTLQLVRNGSNAPSSGLMFDYPGTISNYWLNESSGNAGTIMIGKADQLANGGVLPSYELDLTDTPNGQLPWDYIETIQDANGDTDLQNRTSALRTEHLLPLTKPTFELGSQSNFTGWNDLGKTFQVYIDSLDPRFPDGKTIVERLMGWSLTPESDSQPEIIRFVLAGD
jgi:hypothetical protein